MIGSYDFGNLYFSLLCELTDINSEMNRPDARGHSSLDFPLAKMTRIRLALIHDVNLGNSDFIPLYHP